MFGMKKFGQATARPSSHVLRNGDKPGEVATARRWHNDAANSKTEASCAPLVAETPIEKFAMFGINLLGIKEDEVPVVIDESTGRPVLVLPAGVVKLRAPATDINYYFGHYQWDDMDNPYRHDPVEWMSTYPIPEQHLPEISWVYRKPIIPVSEMTPNQLNYEEQRAASVAWAEARELKQRDSEERREDGSALGVRQETASAAQWRLEMELSTRAPDPTTNPLAEDGDTTTTYAESYARLYGEVIDPPWAKWQKAYDDPNKPEYDKYKIQSIVAIRSYGATEYNLTDAEYPLNSAS